MQEQNEIITKLLNSNSLKALINEGIVFKELSKLKWKTEHSAYFVDPSSKKLRELDIKGRKYFRKDRYIHDVEIYIECKSIKDYHIIANNKVKNDYSEFDFICVANYVEKGFNKLDEILFKYKFNTEECNYIKSTLKDYCYPKNVSFFSDNKLAPFNIQTFNTYRETNIGSEKDIDTSVIWKCIMSLQSAKAATEQLLLDNIEHSIIQEVNENTFALKNTQGVIKSIELWSDVIYYNHPVIVVESKLWELTDKNELKELKFFRLNIQQFFQEGFWIDIVNIEHINEYLKKTKEYTIFYKNRGFKFD